MDGQPTCFEACLPQSRHAQHTHPNLTKRAVYVKCRRLHEWSQQLLTKEHLQELHDLQVVRVCAGVQALKLVTKAQSGVLIAILKS